MAGHSGHWASRIRRSYDNGLKHGFRSGLEEKNARHLEANRVPVLYEVRTIRYTVPRHRRRYTLDFELPNGILVETKGRFLPKDRAKHLYIKLEYPDLDVRFVFQNPGAPINKGSPTSYGEWATAHGFKWAKGLIPVEWLEEPGPGRSVEEILSHPAIGFE